MIAQGQDDVEEFGRTQQAMQFIGFEQGSVASIFKVLASILHMGNLEIKDEGEGSSLLQSTHVGLAVDLLGLEANAFCKAVCERAISVGHETLMKPETADKARNKRDALAKALYSRLFDFVVKHVNAALDHSEGASSTTPLSVLDIFGFEVFKENHFEQVGLLVYMYCLLDFILGASCWLFPGPAREPPRPWILFDSKRSTSGPTA